MSRPASVWSALFLGRPISGHDGNLLAICAHPGLRYAWLAICDGLLLLLLLELSCKVCTKAETGRRLHLGLCLGQIHPAEATPFDKRALAALCACWAHRWLDFYTQHGRWSAHGHEQAAAVQWDAGQHEPPQRRGGQKGAHHTSLPSTHTRTSCTTELSVHCCSAVPSSCRACSCSTCARL